MCRSQSCDPPHVAARLVQLGFERRDPFIKGKLRAQLIELSPKLRNLLGEPCISLADIVANVILNHWREAGGERADFPVGHDVPFIFCRNSDTCCSRL
jgi:hypothetical protein